MNASVPRAAGMKVKMAVEKKAAEKMARKKNQGKKELIEKRPKEEIEKK